MGGGGTGAGGGAVGVMGRCGWWGRWGVVGAVWVVWGVWVERRPENMLVVGGAGRVRQMCESRWCCRAKEGYERWAVGVVGEVCVGLGGV